MGDSLSETSWNVGSQRLGYSRMRMPWDNGRWMKRSNSQSVVLCPLPTRQAWYYDTYRLAKRGTVPHTHSPSVVLCHLPTRQAWYCATYPLAKCGTVTPTRQAWYCTPLTVLSYIAPRDFCPLRDEGLDEGLTLEWCSRGLSGSESYVEGCRV